jgi:Flp pilus assembly protein TadB
MGAMTALVARRRERNAVDAVPALLEHVAAALRGGSTVLAALGTASQSGPFCSALRAVQARASAGVPLRVALQGLSAAHPLPGVRLAVAAMTFGLDAGGGHAATLDAVAQGVRDGIAHEREVRALSATARASGFVIGAAPLAFAAVVAVIDPNLSGSLFTTGFGRRSLVVGLLLDGVGLWWIHRLLRIHSGGGELSEAIDLFALAVRSGLTIDAALRAVAERATGDVGVALRVVVARVEAGARLADELRDLPGRLGERVRPLVVVLLSALHDGAPIAATLERLADDARRERRAQAQERARKMPVLLLFPLVICVLPAFVLLAIAPVLVDAFASLHHAA